jgi:hypothetical protein
MLQLEGPSREEPSKNERVRPPEVAGQGRARDGSAKSVEIKLSPKSAARLLDALLRPDAQGQVISILVDKDDLAASVLW